MQICEPIRPPATMPSTLTFEVHPSPRQYTPAAPLAAVRALRMGGRGCARQLVEEVVALYQVALFVSTNYFVFLLTTVVGVYRWIFQVGNRSGPMPRRRPQRLHAWYSLVSGGST